MYFRLKYFDGEYMLLFFQVYKKEKEEEQKRALANNTQYKRYRRYMKKGGPGQMAMGPE